MNAPIFNQPNWQVGEAYNVAGNLNLTRTSSREDFLQALRQLKLELAGLDRIDAAQRADLEADLDAVVVEASGPEPSKERVVTRLESVRQRLTAFGKVMSRALEVAASVAIVAAWAASFL
jgi:hypothetical protein